MYFVFVTEFEKNMLAAAGEIQSQLQCVVTVAPSPDMNSHYEVLRYYQEAGGDEQKVLMLNIDRKIYESLCLICILTLLHDAFG